VVERTVENGGRQDLVVEDLSPVDEALVAREDEACPLIAAHQEPEEETRFLPGERQIADLVENEELGIDELLERTLEPILVTGKQAEPDGEFGCRLGGRPRTKRLRFSTFMKQTN
jgi:hypothetical protein